MAVLKQTLYFSAVPTADFTDNSGSGSTHTNWAAVGGTHDASDATKSYINALGLFEVGTPDAFCNVYRALDTASAPGNISFVRMKYRARRNGTATSPSDAIQPLINGTLRGSPNSPTTSWADYQQDFTTDPADSNPWTNAKINAQTFGFKRTVSSTGDTDNWNAETSEFSLEVWGPDPVTVTATPAAGAGAASGYLDHTLRHPSAASGIVAGEVAGAAAAATAASVGVTSLGEPYFAMWMQDAPDFPGWGGGERTLRAVAAFYAAPQQHNSPQEPHWFVSIHRPEIGEQFALGITPDRRLVGFEWLAGDMLVMSDAGVVPVDGSVHEFEIFFAGGTLIRLSIDGQVVAAHDGYGTVSAYDAASLVGTRLMAFNGANGLTRVPMSIARIDLFTENTNFEWLFQEGSGQSVHGEEVYVGGPDFPGTNFDLTAGWYDPRPYYPLSWGGPPVSNVQSGFRWQHRTNYKPATVHRPTYRAAAGGSTLYRPPTGGAST